MKKITLLFVLLSLHLASVSAQDQTEPITPITFDRSILSGVGLKKIDLKDEPEKDFYQRRLYWGKELGVFIVGTETWTNEISNYPFDEFVYMYNGEAIVKPADGPSQIFYSGEYFFAPKGFKGQWEVKGNNQIHYEFSIITTTRADSTAIIPDATHKRFDPAVLSGNGIHLNDDGYYEETLEKGAELTVKLVGEQIGERSLSESQQEQCIHIIAGQITIIDKNGKEYTYYAGDFFLIPIGLVGTWRTEGHKLVKYLLIEQTKN